MGWKHYQTVDHPKREPQVGSGLFGIRLLILHFKFPFTKGHQIFNISYSPQFNLSFEKKCIFPKMPKNHPVVNVMSIEIQSCLKRGRDIGRKAVLCHVKTAFTCTPALNEWKNWDFLLYFPIPNLDIAFLICLALAINSRSVLLC